MFNPLADDGYWGAMAKAKAAGWTPAGAQTGGTPAPWQPAGAETGGGLRLPVPPAGIAGGAARAGGLHPLLQRALQQWSARRPQAMANYQGVFLGRNPEGTGDPHIGGVDFPPADMHDPFMDFTDNPIANNFFGNLSGFGTSPTQGFSAFGNTIDPTFWVNYPGVGNVPMAVPTTGWAADPSQGQSGGMINPHAIRTKVDA